MGIIQSMARAAATTTLSKPIGSQISRHLYFPIRSSSTVVGGNLEQNKVNSDICLAAGPSLVQRRSRSTKNRMNFKMSKHRYLRNVKKVRYISAIPQYTGPLGRQTKKRAIVKDYRRSPRLRH